MDKYFRASRLRIFTKLYGRKSLSKKLISDNIKTFLDRKFTLMPIKINIFAFFHPMPVPCKNIFLICNNSMNTSLIVFENTPEYFIQCYITIENYKYRVDTSNCNPGLQLKCLTILWMH